MVLQTNTLLLFSYCLVAALYLISGILLLVKPKSIERFIPKLFPLLDHFGMRRISSALGLIAVGGILVIVAGDIADRKFIGFFSALVLSAWEVYLSLTFYRRYHSLFDVLSHFFIHIGIVFFVGWLLLSDYGAEINSLAGLEFFALTPTAESFSWLVEVFHNHIGWVAFLSVLFGGEPAMLILSFLSGQGEFHPLLVGAVGFATALLAEVFWFFLGRETSFDFLRNGFFSSRFRNGFFQKIRGVLDRKPFRSLFLARFISGITIPCIVYFGRRRMPIGRFVSYCLVINLFWTPTIVLVGWSAGRGFTLILDTFKNLQIALDVLFVFFLAGYFIYSFGKHAIRKKIIQD